MPLKIVLLSGMVKLCHEPDPISRPVVTDICVADLPWQVWSPCCTPALCTRTAFDVYARGLIEDEEVSHARALFSRATSTELALAMGD